MFGFRYCKYLTRVKTRIHFTHKPQKDQGERKEKEKEDWQVKSIIFLEVHRGTEPYKTHSANLLHPFPASQYSYKMNTGVQQQAKFQAKWPYWARWSQTHTFLTPNQRTELQGGR